MSRKPPQIIITASVDSARVQIQRMIQASEFSAVSLIEIEPEGASITIDQVRSLRRDIQFSGARDRTIILYAFHRATHEAQNALLKLLEDLAEVHTFILCTERIDAVVTTIRSRCVINQFTESPARRDQTDLLRALDGLEKGEVCQVLADPLFQISTLDEARLRLEEILVALQGSIAQGNYWSVESARHALELLSLSRSNNLNPQLSLDAWVLRSSSSNRD